MKHDGARDGEGDDDDEAERGLVVDVGVVVKCCPILPGIANIMCYWESGRRIRLRRVRRRRRKRRHVPHIITENLQPNA